MALKELRGATQSWIFKIFVALLICSFGAWGVNDIFRTGGGKGVAKVGGDWISAQSYQDRLRTAAQRMSRQQGKPVSLEFVQETHLGARVIDQMIGERALDIYAHRLHLEANDESLTKIIRSMQAFQGPDGQFDQRTYEGTLRQNDYTPPQFVAMMRSDMVRAQLQTALTRGTFMPRGLIANLLAINGEMREVSYVLLDPSLAGDVPAPDNATLQKFVNDNKASYSTPELRTFSVLMFRPQDFVPVSETELSDFYQKHIDNYTIEPEKRSEREISFPDEAAAQAAMKALQSHAKTFEQIGTERGLSGDALAFKPQSVKDISDPEVAKAVFSAKTPGLVGPINGALNWFIAEFKDVTPGRVKPFEDVKEEVRADVAGSHTGIDDTITDATNKFEDARAGGSTPEEIAKKFNVPLVKYDAVDAQGKDRNGKAVVTGPGAQEILKAAFDSETGTDNDPQPFAQGGQFVMRVDSTAPPAVRPFSEIAAQALADYQGHERGVRLKMKADALAAAHAKEGLGAVASELGVPAASLPAPLKRVGESDVLSPELVEALFNARPESLVVGDAAQPGKMVIATVMRVDRPSPEEVAQSLKAIAPKLDGSLAENLSDAFVGAARQKLKARVEPAALDRATSSTRL